MGTDIHAVWQAKKNGPWVDVPSRWDQGRHYFLFAWLADVRNGRGFAGTPTHTRIQPITQPRGWPADFCTVSDEHPTVLEALPEWRRKYLEEHERAEPRAWMGDHTYSWLTADEILAATRPGRTLHTGVVRLAQFRAWDGVSPPSEYCGDVFGGKTLVSHPNEITDQTTHVRIEWFDDDDGLDYFINEVRRMKDEHGEVRIVFGFDS